jgi:hypothetical protein
MEITGYDDEIIFGDCIVEKEIFLSGDGEDIADIDAFNEMKKEHEKHNINLATVIGAEGEYVCIAPEPLARLIAKLLTEYKTE